MKPQNTAVVAPTLIGRQEQMTELTGLLALAAAGQSRFVLVAGEAGVGKSRLVAELRAAASVRGLTVVQGRCFEEDRTFPYAPVLDLLRHFCAGRATAELAHLFAPVAPELTQWLPELAALPAAAASGHDPEQQKRRLLQSLTQFVQRLAEAGRGAGQPLLLIIEDLHWCDDASLEWLLYMARQLVSQPLLVLLTYRHEENHPLLHQLLAALARMPLVSELLLETLTRADVEAMLCAIFDMTQPPRAEFVDALFALTAGNPFFLEEVLKSLIAAGDIYRVSGEWTRKPLRDLQIPRSVQVAVQQRTRQLSQPAQRLLTAAAVAGQRFDFTVLQLVTQQGESDLLEQVKELIAAQLVVEESDETFAFRHALTRQAIYTGLLGRERKPLHRRLAAALEECHADSLELYAGDLAHHCYEAGEWAAALAWAQRAAARAEQLFAHSETLHYYTLARVCADKLGRAELMAAIDQAIGRVHDERGEAALASAAYARALQLTHDPALRSALKVDLGSAYVNLADERGVVFLEQALQELDRTTQGKQTVMAMLWLARHYHLCAQYTQALAYLGQVRTLIEPLADAPLLRLFYGSMAIVLMYSARFEESMVWARRGVQLGEAQQDARAVVLGFLYLAENSEYLGRWQETAEFGSRGRQAARQAGWQSMEVWTDLERLVVAYYRGELEAGSQLAHDCLATAHDLDERRALLHTQKLLVLIDSARGLEEDAYRLGAAAVREVDAVVGVGIRCWIRLALAGLQMQRAEWEQAAALYEECTALLAGGENRVIQMELGAPMAEAYVALGRVEEAAALIVETLALTEAAGALHYAAVAQRVHGQVCAAQGRADDALAACTRAIAGCRALGSRLELALACYQRGAMHQARGDFAAARADWLEAGALCAQMGAHALHWRVHAALGQLAHAQQRRVEAEREFASARAIVTQLAAAMQDESFRQHLWRRAEALLPREPLPLARRDLKAASGGLTARERQVAALIAQGKSNREIAAALVVSERTVTTHVSNIFSKLGFTARTQVAAWASEHKIT
jgi:DNA-binding CsgD family transcriptional regulator